MYDYETQAKSLVAAVGDEVTCVCALCGRMYKARPLLCLCKSNVFLEELEEPEILTQEIQELARALREKRKL